MSVLRGNAGNLLLKIVIGGIIASWSLVPIYWAVVVSLSTPAAIRQIPPQLVPSPLTLENYLTLLSSSDTSSGNYLLAMLNSVVEAGATTIFTIAIALPAAYAFARVRFRGSVILLSTIVVTIAVPVYLVLIPLFQISSSLGQINTRQIVVVIFASAALPIAILILRSHIMALPISLEEAARLDGAPAFTIMTRIVGPLVAPGIVAAAVFVFLTSWGQYLVPVVFANSVDVQPLTVLIPKFATKYAQDLGLQAAAGILAIGPPAILVIVLQRYLVSGLLKGAGR